MAIVKNLRVTRGRTKKQTQRVLIAGVARDITNDLIWMTVKDLYSETDGQALFQLSIGSGISLSDPTNGYYQWTIDPSHTSSCPSQRTVYKYDRKILFDTGEAYDLAKGEFAVEPDVTNTTT